MTFFSSKHIKNAPSIFWKIYSKIIYIEYITPDYLKVELRKGDFLMRNLKKTVLTTGLILSVAGTGAFAVPGGSVLAATGTEVSNPTTNRTPAEVLNTEALKYKLNIDKEFNIRHNDDIRTLSKHQKNANDKIQGLMKTTEQRNQRNREEIRKAQQTFDNKIQETRKQINQTTNQTEKAVLQERLTTYRLQRDLYTQKFESNIQNDKDKLRMQIDLIKADVEKDKAVVNARNNGYEDAKAKVNHLQQIIKKILFPVQAN